MDPVASINRGWRPFSNKLKTGGLIFGKIINVSHSDWSCYGEMAKDLDIVHMECGYETVPKL